MRGRSLAWPRYVTWSTIECGWKGIGRILCGPCVHRLLKSWACTIEPMDRGGDARSGRHGHPCLIAWSLCTDATGELGVDYCAVQSLRSRIASSEDRECSAVLDACDTTNNVPLPQALGKPWECTVPAEQVRVADLSMQISDSYCASSLPARREWRQSQQWNMHFARRCFSQLVLWYKCYFSANGFMIRLMSGWLYDLNFGFVLVNVIELSSNFFCCWVLKGCRAIVLW